MHFIGMRIALNIDGRLLSRAADLTGIKKKTSLIRLGLEALIARESDRRLAELGGTEKTLAPFPGEGFPDGFIPVAFF